MLRTLRACAQCWSSCRRFKQSVSTEKKSSSESRDDAFPPLFDHFSPTFHPLFAYFLIVSLIVSTTFHYFFHSVLVATSWAQMAPRPQGSKSGQASEKMRSSSASPSRCRLSEDLRSYLLILHPYNLIYLLPFLFFFSSLLLASTSPAASRARRSRRRCPRPKRLRRRRRGHRKGRAAPGAAPKPPAPAAAAWPAGPRPHRNEGTHLQKDKLIIDIDLYISSYFILLHLIYLLTYNLICNKMKEVKWSSFLPILQATPELGDVPIPTSKLCQALAELGEAQATALRVPVPQPSLEETENLFKKSENM